MTLLLYFSWLVDFLKLLLASHSSSLVDNGFSVLNKVVDQNWPSSLILLLSSFEMKLVLSVHLLVIVAQVIIDGRCEVQQEVPGVFWNGSFMMFLEKCVPQVQELESVSIETVSG